MDEKNSKEILERFKLAYNVKTFKQLADKLEISYSSLDNWKLRNAIPEKYLLKTAQECNISVDWLKTGKDQNKEINIKFTINNKLAHFPLKAIISLTFILEKYNNINNRNELFNKIEDFYEQHTFLVKPNASLDFTSKLDRKVLINFIEYFLTDDDILVIFNNKEYYLNFLEFLKDSKRFF